MLLALAFRLAGRVVFHTDAERAALERDYHVRVHGALVPHRVLPTGHVPRARRPGRRWASRATVPCSSARGSCSRQGLRCRLSTRFAASGAADHGARLYVVGSVRDRTPENVAHVEGLRRLAEATPGVALHLRFLSDAEFDAWIVAADAVVLPYRRTWSSGVLARAQALRTPAIVSAEGGLAEQAGPADTVVDGDRDLAEAMARVRPGRPAIAGGAGDPNAGVASPIDGEAEDAGEGFWPAPATREWDIEQRDRKESSCSWRSSCLGHPRGGRPADAEARHEPGDPGRRPAARPDASRRDGRARRLQLLGVAGVRDLRALGGVWLVVLSRASLSFAYPFASLTYVIILLFDRSVLDQSIPGIRYAGVALIVAGIVLVSRTHA